MPMIPKDGQRYLAWDKMEGYVTVFWLNDEYQISMLYDIGRYRDISNIQRWMDKKGQWHEVEREPQHIHDHLEE